MKAEKSSVRNADLNEGNDLIVRTPDGMLFQQSILLLKDYYVVVKGLSFF